MDPIAQENPRNSREKQLISKLLGAVRSIRYGCVQIIIHNGEVVQIEKTEKVRLDAENLYGQKEVIRD